MDPVIYDKPLNELFLQFQNRSSSDSYVPAFFDPSFNENIPIGKTSFLEKTNPKNELVRNQWSFLRGHAKIFLTWENLLVLSWKKIFLFSENKMNGSRKILPSIFFLISILPLQYHQK